jgi:uncharacterized protein YwgA
MTGERKDKIVQVLKLVHDAGGKIIGRTRLQKTAYLLTLAGFEDCFHFDYHYYGPYSDDLAMAASTAHAMKRLKEEGHHTSWGGFYSTYEIVAGDQASGEAEDARHKLIKKAISANSIVLELAATAAYFADKKNSDPWGETEQRKPEKAEEGRLAEAKKLYAELREIASTLPAC